MSKLKIIYLFTLVLLSACSEYSRVLKSADNEYKFDKALAYFNEGEHNKSLPLFEDLISVYRGTQKSEQIYYYYAVSYTHLTLPTIYSV